MKLAGGSTTVALDKGVAGALTEAGVKVAVTKPGKAGSEGHRVPDLAAARSTRRPAPGAIDHSGGLTFKAGAHQGRPERVRRQGRQALDAEREGRQGPADGLLARHRQGEGQAQRARHDHQPACALKLTGKAAAGAQRRLRREAVRQGPRGRQGDRQGDAGTGAARRRLDCARARSGRGGRAGEPRRRGVAGGSGDGRGRRLQLPDHGRQAERQDVRRLGRPQRRHPADQGRHERGADRLHDQRRRRTRPDRARRRPARLDPVARPLRAERRRPRAARSRSAASRPA